MDEMGEIKVINNVPGISANSLPKSVKIIRRKRVSSAKPAQVSSEKVIEAKLEEQSEEEGPTPIPEQKPQPTYLAKKNAHERDQYISFDEGPHVYTVHGESDYTSVTTWNHMLFSQFNEEAQIKKIVGNKKWRTDPTYKYYQKTAQEIKDMWETNRVASSTAGTNLHFNIECFYNQIPVENDSIEYQYFLKFVEDYPELEAYRTEWCVFDQELKLSGSIDMVFRDKNTGEFLIYDWKRSKEIDYESYGNKTSHVECISHLPNCNFWTYSLQLNTYRYILEKNYGFKISGMYLIRIHPDNPYETYDRIEVHDLRKEIEDLADFRRKLLKGEVQLSH